MAQQKFGRYIIKGTLGRGAMGMVYLALDPILDRLSAIKVMNTGGEVDEGLRTRFFREAKSAARLRHPNIIAIYEMGEEGKRPFIAMEYVEGEDLKALIEKRTFIPFEQKIRILVQVCEALSYAHQQGVIHRDIKPANVRIAQDGEVRLLDFGLARLGSSDITRTGMLMGTPYYMSPEQVRGVRDLDGRSDLFSAAVLLYELLAYARPFEAESSTEVCLKIVSEPHTPLSSVLPKVDADLAAIIDRALSKNRDARQPDCQDLARALKGYAQSVPQRLPGLESEVARLEKEWKSCCDASQHLVQLGILEEALLAPPSPTPAPSIDPEETTVYNFSLEASQRDFGTLLLAHARLHGRLEEVRQRLRAAVPLQELFERSQHQLAQGQFEDCLKTSAEILEMVPLNARALDIQRECRRLIEERRVEEERRARLTQALALASEALEHGNLAQCIQSASRALQIDPGHSQAQELKQQASEALVRRRKVAELLAAARGFHKAQNYESAGQACAEALALDPGHAELRLIQQKSQQVLERQSQIREWLNHAQEKLQARDYLAVLGTTDQLLTLEPDLPRALDMQQQAAEALERQLKLEELVAQARGCEMAGDFEECLRVCDQALQISPENPEVLDLGKRASETLAKQRRIAELLSRGREEIARREFALATETGREAIGLDPGDRTAQELLQTAEAGHRRQQRVAELFALAQSHQTQRNFQGCLDVTNEALALDPAHPGHLELRRLALDALERVRQFEQHLEAARQCDEVEDYARALEQLEQALELDGGNAGAVQLKQLVAAKLDRRSQLSACLEAARQHLQSDNYAGCLGSAQRALQLDADNAEASALCSQATEALARLEQETRLLTQARRRFEEQQYEMAIEGADELLHLNPHHSGARALKQQATETQDRRQRFEACLVAARNHAKSQDYSACLAAATEALAIEPQHAELRRLQEKAVQALEKERATAAGLERCRQHLANEDYAAALEAVDEVLRLEPKHRDAQALQRQAAEGLAHQQRFEELVVLARNHSKAQDHAACLKAADEALALKPEHAEIRKLRDKSFQALEHLRAIDAGLAKARQALSEERFLEAQGAAQEVLALESQHTDAIGLARTASEGRQRQQRIEQLAEEAQRKLEQRDYLAGLGAAEEGLRLKGNHAALLELHKTLKQAVERQQTLARWIEKARKQLDVRDYAGAIETCDQCLELEAHHSEAWKLHQAASEGMERRQKVDELQATAKGYYTAKDYDACLKSVREALSLEPEDAELQSLQREASQALEREQRLAALLEDAQRSFQEQRFTDALGLLNGLLSTDASHAAAIRLKEKVSREWQKVQQVEQLLGEARDQASQGNWEACRKKTQEGLKLAPNQEELQQIHDRAERELEKRKRVTELLKNCRAVFQEGQFEGTLPLAGQILELEPGHPEASELRAKAAAALEHQRQIRELLEAAQAHERAGELELALEKARAGLQLEARNAQFLPIQSRTTAALEHRRRVSGLLSEARQQLNNHQYEASLRASEELLKLEREHPEGQALKQAAASALERLRQLNQSLAQAKAKAKAGLWEECLKVVTEALRLDPAHAELTALASQASEILDKRRTLQELLDSGRGQLGRGEHEAALKSAERALQLAPDNAGAAQLKQQAQSALEARKKRAQVTALLAEARKHEQSGDVEACYRTASEGLNLEPEHAELKALRESSGGILETRRQIQILLERARQQWQAEDFLKVVETAASMLKLDPENAKAADFKLKAEQEMDRRQRLKELLSQAKRADKDKDHEACLRSAEEGLVLDSGHAELQRLQSRSRQMLEQIRRIAQLLQQARAEIEAQNYAAALKALDSALQLEGSNVEAVQLKQKAQEAWQRQKRLEGLLNDAQRQLKAGQFEACLESAGQGLALEAGHPLFKELIVEAKRQLELRRQIGDGLKRAAQHLEKKEYQAAIEACDSVLKLAPGQAEATEGRQRAQQALQRQQRLEVCLARAQAAFGAKDFHGCQTAAQEGLGLEPGHPALHALAKQAAHIIERTQRAQQLWNEASQSQQKGDLPGCLRSLDLLLELEPENVAARELRPKIVESLEQQRRAAGLLAEAASLEKSGDLEACQRLVEQALQLDPHHSQAQQFHQRVSLALDRRRRIQKLLEQAEALFKAHDDAGALKVAEDLLRLDPAHARGLEIQSLASKRLEHRKSVEELLLQARQAQDARDPETCLRAAEQGLQLEPDHAEFKKLEAQSREQLERQRKVRELVSECQRQLGAGAFEASIAAAKSLESLDPGNTVAAEIRQKANEGLERRRRLAGLLARARKLNAAGDFAACHTVCTEALEIDPSNPELLELRDKAFKVLEARRHEEERQRQMQQLLASAKASLQGGRFRAAQSDLMALLELDAAHAEARRLLVETEAQLALARQKNSRLVKLAAAAVLAVSFLGSGIWYAMHILKQAPGTPPSQTNSVPIPAKPQMPAPQPPPEPSTEDREIARLLDTSLGLLREKKYAEAEKAAGELLARSPNHADAGKIKQEARKSLEAIDDGLKRARTLLGRKQYAEVASALGAVLAVDGAHPEALRLMAQVDKYARSNAQDAQKQMRETKQRAAQAGAPSLVQNEYQTASLFETNAIRLFEGKRFGEATGKFYEASEAYVRAEAAARTKTELARDTAAREKAAKDNELAAKAAERQQEERERQTKLQRNQAQSDWDAYQKALSRASQVGADRLATDIFQQATSLGSRAQDQFSHGNYASAQADFGGALRQLESAIGRAEETTRQRRQDEERQQKEAAAQNRPEPPPPPISGSVQKADDRQLVFQVLRRYEAAMNHQSIKELRELWPGLAKEEERKIEESFKFAKSMQSELQPSGEPRISEDTAAVNCRRVVQISTPNGGKPKRNESNITVILRKKGGNWIIETIQ